PPIAASRARWAVTASSTGRGGSAAPALLKCSTLATPGVSARSDGTSREVVMAIPHCATNHHRPDRRWSFAGYSALQHAPFVNRLDHVAIHRKPAALVGRRPFRRLRPAFCELLLRDLEIGEALRDIDCDDVAVFDQPDRP